MRARKISDFNNINNKLHFYLTSKFIYRHTQTLMSYSALRGVADRILDKKNILNSINLIEDIVKTRFKDKHSTDYNYYHHFASAKREGSFPAPATRVAGVELSVYLLSKISNINTLKKNGRVANREPLRAYSISIKLYSNIKKLIINLK